MSVTSGRAPSLNQPYAREARTLLSSGECVQASLGRISTAPSPEMCDSGWGLRN